VAQQPPGRLDHRRRRPALARARLPLSAWQRRDGGAQARREVRGRGRGGGCG
jgi:hypothetical protein